MFSASQHFCLWNSTEEVRGNSVILYWPLWTPCKLGHMCVHVFMCVCVCVPMRVHLITGSGTSSFRHLYSSFKGRQNGNEEICQNRTVGIYKGWFKNFYVEISHWYFTCESQSRSKSIGKNCRRCDFAIYSNRHWSYLFFDLSGLSLSNLWLHIDVVLKSVLFFC